MRLMCFLPYARTKLALHDSAWSGLACTFANGIFFEFIFFETSSTFVEAQDKLRQKIVTNETKNKLCFYTG